MRFHIHLYFASGQTFFPSLLHELQKYHTTFATNRNQHILSISQKFLMSAVCLNI